MLVTLILGLLLVCGLAAGQMAARFDLPRVAAYVLTGVAFSPDLLGGLLNIHVNDWAQPLTLGALGVVAYLIGASMTFKQLRRMGRTILGSALGESLGAVVVVFVAIWWLAPDMTGASRFTLALALAAIAATTAPASTVALLHQYHAKGPLSTTLLGVVALDDALGIMFFSFMLVVVAGDSLAVSSAKALLAIVGSLALGAVWGAVLSRYGRRVKESALLLPMVLGVILLVVGIAELLHWSPLLAAMALGFTTRQSSGASGVKFSAPIEYLEETVFVVFFTLAGAHFEASVFLQLPGLAALYLVARVIGKVLGAAAGARLVGAPSSVVRWLGLGLVPQAGVAIGLALSLSHSPHFQELSGPLLNCVLATTLVYELVGPFAARFALARAGELGPKRNKVEL